MEFRNYFASIFQKSVIRSNLLDFRLTIKQNFHEKIIYILHFIVGVYIGWLFWGKGAIITLGKF